MCKTSEAAAKVRLETGTDGDAVSVNEIEELRKRRERKRPPASRT